jgi:diguanylate cyclase (GGDEF)-like protein/PAS domain S-box-containing protein
VSGPDAPLGALAAASGVAVVCMDQDGRITEWAGQAAAVFGWEREQVIGRDLAATIIPAFYRAAHTHGLRRHLAGREASLIGRPVELRALRRDGTEFPVEMVVVREDPAGGGTVFTAMLRDVSALRRSDQLGAMQLAVSQLLMDCAESGLAAVMPEVLGIVGDTLRCQAVLTWTPDPSGELRLEHAWHDGTPGLQDLCDRAGRDPLPQAELAGRMHRFGTPFVVQADMAHGNALLADASGLGLRWMAVLPLAHGGPPAGTLVLLSTEMLALDEELLRAMSNLGGQLGQALARDAAERARVALERDLRHQAFHDQLTGLANRALFIDRLEHSLRRATRDGSGCAVLLLDLDDFKRVNDTRGHQAGDRLVQAVAARLCERLRPGDSVARLGGDEFAMLLEDVDGAAGAEAAAERVLETLRHPFRVDGRELVASGSVGVALSAGAGGAEELMRNADLAMYVAKSRGKGRHARFEPAMLSAMIERVTLEQEMRSALAREQFAVLYQPQVDIASGRITGAEALVRWRHPARGWLDADAFIHHAEESRLIGSLGAWVLGTACTAARRWTDRGLPPLRVAVNVSAHELEVTDLESSVRAALADTRLPASRLELEITETASVGRHRDTLARLDGLRRLGVRIAIDDFGTGYSMLGRLQAFPVDRLKIDRSFIEAISVSTDRAPLVEAIIGMAHGLGLSVVAEGVETLAQLGYLRGHACDAVQGYLTGLPINAASFEDLLLATGGGTAPLHSVEPELALR